MFVKNDAPRPLRRRLRLACLRSIPMSNKYLEILTHVVRHPRHVVQGGATVVVSIERAQPVPTATSQPEVIDFSRGGCRFRWKHELQKNEPIVLRVTDNSSGISLEAAGTVRWCRVSKDEHYEIGCQFDQELNYEHLGELFIAGFLSTEEVAAT